MYHEIIHVGYTKTKLATELPGGYTVFPDVGVAYKYFVNQVPWYAARRYCMGHGGNLAVIDSYEKIEYVTSLKKGDSHIHVGMHRLFDDAEWTDVRNDSPVAAIPWRVTSYDTEQARKCMGLVVVGSIGLFAVACNERMAFVCEIPISKNRILAVTDPGAG